MDDRALELAATLVTARYVEAGAEALRGHERTLRSLLAQRRCPDDGLSDELIEMLLMQLSLMDTNNFPGHVGGGEREGRVASALVRRRVYGMTHGIGRSGDLNADQPKAAGSSLLYQITNAMVLDLVRLAGAVSTQAAAVVPMATGMTLALVLRAVANDRVKAAEASSASVTPRYVIWPRIDQKTCLKCIEAAGLVPCVVPLRTARTTHPTPSASASPHFLQVHVGDVERAIARVGGPQAVVCVLSTTSCFAPRLPDDTVAMALLCKRLGVPYVVNNAYGLQSRATMSRLDAAQRLGRVDFFVQSGDKNFLVPVGGSVVCSGDSDGLKSVMALYAGRASAAPVVDLFVTVLGLGRRGFARLWEERYARRQELGQALCSFALARGEALLDEIGEWRVDAEVLPGHAEPGGTEGEPEPGGSSSPPPSSPRPSPAAAGGGHRGRPERSKSKGKRAVARNDISFCITMRHYHEHAATRTGAPAGGREARGGKPSSEGQVGAGAGADEERRLAVMCDAAKAFGAKLFRRGVTGPRVIVPSVAGDCGGGGGAGKMSNTTRIVGCSFSNYGMHQESTHHDDDDDDVGPPTESSAVTAAVAAAASPSLSPSPSPPPPFPPRPPCPLLVVACGIGMSSDDVTGLMTRLNELWPAP